MIHRIFVCLSSIALILGESPREEGYHQRGYENESRDVKIEEISSEPRYQNSKFSDSGFEEDAEDDEERKTPRRGIVDPEVADQLEGNGWLDVIPGIPGKDYPNYTKIPETSFTCDDKTSGGYYADIETRCQVFHVCSTDGRKISFVCPNGSIFNQKYFVCDWWYDFECDDATDLYSLNEKINRGGTGSGPSGPGRVEENVEYFSSYKNDHPSLEDDIQNNNNNNNFVSADGYDLSLAGTGEGGPGYAQNGKNKGYESNVNDDDHRDEKKNGQYDVKTDKNSSNGGKNGKQNSAGNENHGVDNHHYQSTRENSNVQLKTDNFRNGNHAVYNRGEESNGFNENNRPDSTTNPNENEQAHKNHNVNKFGQRYSENSSYDSTTETTVNSDYANSDVDKEEIKKQVEREEERKIIDSGIEIKDNRRYNYPNENLHPGRSSSGLNNNEYRTPPIGSRPSNIRLRGRQRANEGLPEGLGNGYSSSGRARELPGSDVIPADGITPGIGGAGTFYDKGDQGALNSKDETFSYTRTQRLSDDQRDASENQNQGSSKRTDLNGDDNYHRENNHQQHRRRQNSGEKNYPGNDYLVGIVQGNDGTDHSDQQRRRFLPIL